MLRSAIACNSLIIVILSILSVCFLFLNAESVQADTPRLEQLLKNSHIGAIQTNFSQSFSCADLSGTIESVTLSLTSVNASNVPFYVYMKRSEENPGTPVVLARTSPLSYTGGRNQQKDITFTFPTAIEVENDLCSGGGTVYIIIQSQTENSNSNAYLNGSALNVYSGGSAGSYPGADAYFIINGQATSNQAPVLSQIGPRLATEGSLLKFSVVATDRDQVNAVDYSAVNLPDGAVFTGNTLYWVPNFLQAGTHENITIIATDSGNDSFVAAASTEMINVNVAGAVPVYNRFEQLVNSNQIGVPDHRFSQSFSCSSLGGNIGSITLSLASVNAANVPLRAYFQMSEEYPDSGAVKIRTSSLAHTGPRNQKTDVMFVFPSPIDVSGDLCAAGGTVYLTVETIQFTNTAQTALYGSATNPYSGGSAGGYSGADVYFVINDQMHNNNAPELSTIGNQTINEGGILQFTVSATDADNDSITLSANNLPTGATFNSSTGLFYWNTDFDDAGNYTDVEFTATDNGTPMELDLELITITVGDVNRMPELSNPGPQVVLEEDSLSFTILATDPDNNAVALAASNLPSGAVFNPNTGVFTWTPTLADAGVYTVTITATDNGTPTESASTDIIISVGDNPTPTKQAENLIVAVININIPQNVENSYLANLRKVEQFILEGKITAALNQLGAFINKVEQDYDQNLLTQEDYEAFIDAAENLISDLTN